MSIATRHDPEIPWGRIVRYHGSLTAEHGEYRLLEFCECSRCQHADDEATARGVLRRPRYVLAHPRSGAIALECVGPDSVTNVRVASRG